jgi:hypothetical protein
MKSFAIKALGLLALGLILNVAGVLLLALAFKWLWNISLPAVLHISYLTYLQSLGLLGLVFVVGLVARGASIEMNKTTTDL